MSVAKKLEKFVSREFAPIIEIFAFSGSPRVESLAAHCQLPCSISCPSLTRQAQSNVQARSIFGAGMKSDSACSQFFLDFNDSLGAQCLYINCWR